MNERKRFLTALHGLVGPDQMCVKIWQMEDGTWAWSANFQAPPKAAEALNAALLTLQAMDAANDG